MRSLDEGRSFIVTRAGQPVGELRPLRRHRLVDARAAVAAFANAPAIDADRFRADLDAVIDQDLDPSWLIARRQVCSTPPSSSISTSSTRPTFPSRWRSRRSPWPSSPPALRQRRMRSSGPGVRTDCSGPRRRSTPPLRSRGGPRLWAHLLPAVVTSGRTPRRRLADLLIAATAVANDLPLSHTQPDDLVGLEELLTIIAV